MSTLRDQFLRHVGQTSSAPLLLEVERAQGVYFYTPEGEKYFDLIAGVTVNNVGHGNPVVIKAIKDQVDKYMHVMVYGELVERPQVMLAEKLSALLPESLDSVYFVNSGAEAVEGALKLAKRHTGRYELISTLDSYHGSTHGALSVMGAETYKSSYRPLLPATRIIGYNDMAALQFITDKTAAVIMEPVQSEGGVRIPSESYMRAVRERCDRTGALLVFDEIQTGLGRTGRMFGWEHSGVVPDIICLAKALGAGLPLGCFISSREIMSGFMTDPVLGHINTFGGNPVCCAAGLASLSFTLEKDLCANAEQAGALYEELLAGAPNVKEIRRSGLMLAVELGETQLLYRLMGLFREYGIMSDWFLFCDTAFRISPPLIITEDEVRESAALIIECLARL